MKILKVSKMIMLLVMLSIPIISVTSNTVSAAIFGETEYKVVWPLGKWSGKVVPLASPVGDLKGKTICNLIDNETMAEYVPEVLKEKYSGIKIVPRSKFLKGLFGRSGEQNVQVDVLSKLYKEEGCGAVITGVGV
jgi:hypothetical protein